MKKPYWMAGIAVASLAAAALVPASASSGARPAAAVPGCTPATNIAVILDDSGSMGITDGTRQRVVGMKLLLVKPGNAKKTMSALQFGSDASSVFAPGLVGALKAQMSAALDINITANDGATNYNDAFALRKTQNPNANRILFLTDGGHNIGAFANGHQGGPPVDVVGFGTSTAGTDGARLQQIATETKGTYHPQVDANNLPAVMNTIDAIQNCSAPPVSLTHQFTSVGQSQNASISIPSTTKTVDVTLTWNAAAPPVGAPAGTQGNEFDASAFKIVQGGKTVAISKKKKKKRKLKITRSSAVGFQTLRITKVKRGKLKFKLKAKKLATPGVPITLTTQITQGQ